MIRLGAVGTIRDDADCKTAVGEMNIFEGLVIGASPNTKTVKLISPERYSGLKTILRTDDRITINDRVKVFGYTREISPTFKNPSVPSWKWQKRLEGISYELKGTIIHVLNGESHIEAWRKYLAERIEGSGAKYTGIIKALTIGDTTNIDEQIKDLFLKTGTSHILAISGSNIGIITAFFFFVARILMRFSLPMRLRGDDKRYAALLSIPFVFLFMFTAGSGIPIIRATIMITVYMIALLLRRTRHIENAVALSALIILMFYPYSIFMPTFQLTFVSVFSIILVTKTFYPSLRNRHPVAKWFFSSILITASATIGTLPVVLYHFYGINPFAFIHNMIAVPLMSAIAMPLALIGSIVPFGECLLQLSGQIIAFTLWILDNLNRGYIYPLLRPTRFETVSYFSIIVSLFFTRTKSVRFILIFLLVPFLLIYSYLVVHERFYNKSICFHFIDVGLGDAILVEIPRGIRMLIDGGGLYSEEFDIGKSVLTPVLLSKKILSLDYVINTHPHRDHMGGLPYILNHFKVKQFITGAHFLSDPLYNTLLKTAKLKNIPVEFWKRGDIITLNTDTKLHVLHPPRGFTEENLNNRSLVMNMQYGQNNFLLTGDIETPVEEELIASHSSLNADVLKVPHHGSRHSSSPYFLLAVKPVIAVMSAGQGIKGIPSQETLERYRSLSIPVLRTDRDALLPFAPMVKRFTAGHTGSG
jgi:competence protein ComEC